MGGIAVAGNIIVDLIKFIDKYPSKLSLAAITKVDRTMGGAVSNVIIDLARLDPQLKLKAVGYVGEDGNGDFALAQLGCYPSIDLSHVKRSGETSFTDVMTVRQTGERTFFTYKGADSLLTADDFDFQKLDCTLIHFGYILLLDGMDAADAEYGTVMARTMHNAQQAGLLTSVDVVSEDSMRFAALVPPSLKYADYCTVNEFEAQRITGIPLRDEADRLLADNMKGACEALKVFGVRRWVTIHTPESAFGLDEHDVFTAVPSLKVENIAGSVGAGDAFVAGLLYEANRGTDHIQAMRTANAVAACSLSHPTSTGGVRSYAQTMELLHKG